ncbi:unnamed protein product [Polarella glacialis]|uniref:Uncharacterized protein n=2 Tax=Polarella glacialis TaxID=89957 RepID=A0A813HWI9_POLGL|nr:unnamed protein product [Polarella glacialis]
MPRSENGAPEDDLGAPSLQDSDVVDEASVGLPGFKNMPRWGKGVHRCEAVLARFQQLKQVLHNFQGEKRFHNFAEPSLRLTPSEALARRFLYRLRATTTDMGDGESGLVLLSATADALLTGQLRAMAGLAVAVQHDLLPLDFQESALDSEALLRVPALPAGCVYFDGCTYSKQFHWLLQPLMDSQVVQAWRSHVQRRILATTQQSLETWLDKELAADAAAMREALRGRGQADVIGRPLQSPSAQSQAPAAYEKVLRLLREAESSGKWPGISQGRQKVIKDSTLAENGGQGGSFSVGSMPPPLEAPNANLTFPELALAAFELEKALLPDRLPSSTIAINKRAQFLPHVDSGAGAGQGISLIVGLGDYTGGELVVEGVDHDIRYSALEFCGWTQRHWTLPFQGERFSLVWFTPLGCEELPGLKVLGAK